VKKKVQKLTPEAEQVQEKLKASTSQKTYYRLDTEFGVLTVEDAPQKPAAKQPSVKRKPKR